MILSPNQLNSIGVVVLAAGRGTRLGCIDQPKVMLEVGGQPIVSYIVQTLKNLGFSREQIVLVVGFGKEKVYDYFGETVSYSVQEEQLGTAHAAYIGMKKFGPEINSILVLNGDDSLFYKILTIAKLINKHSGEDLSATLLTVPVDPGNFGYGRVVEKNNSFEIIEKEYLTEESAKSTQTSTGTFVFNKEWFLREFPNMPKLERLGEYGLPTAFTLVQEQGLPIGIIKLEDKDEWFGINTAEELAEANSRITNDKN